MYPSRLQCSSLLDTSMLSMLVLMLLLLLLLSSSLLDVCRLLLPFCRRLSTHNVFSTTTSEFSRCKLIHLAYGHTYTYAYRHIQVTHISIWLRPKVSLLEFSPPWRMKMNWIQVFAYSSFYGSTIARKENIKSNNKTEYSTYVFIHVMHSFRFM